ncbi:MAG: PAS domain-containing sensor histidine kinase [Gammaproteobacteria bacterium]|nr:PAS domain-containing sensor histidine kinase [Gammaproteobacteria bacterium]MCW9004642.1 PAS domain-containing sensor histidine kinase [Gammaproteobacteria bacterium]
MSAEIQYIDIGIEDYVSRYAFLLDMQSNAVVILNNKAEFIYANPAFHQLTGLDGQSAPQGALRDLLPRLRRVDSLVNDCLIENRPVVYKDTLNHHGYDRILPLIFNINPVCNNHASPSPEGVIIIIKEDSQQLIGYFDLETEKLSQRILALSDELRNKLKLINSLFDNNPVGMMILDDQCTIMQVNQAGKNILESKSSLVGVSCKRFYNVDIADLKNSQHSIIDPMEIRAVTEAGNEIILLRCSVRSADDDLIYETFVDITEIENARIVLEKANQAKSDFLANMTHELQTPLNIILGFSQLGAMVNNDSDLDEIKSSFQNIMKSGEVLRQFINNILDISKAEAGRLTFNKEMQLIKDVVVQVVVDCAVLCVDKGIIIDFELDDLDECECEFDSVRMQQVIRNLLSNAIKFSPEKSEIKITGNRLDDYIEIRVIDDGPGIPEEELEIVFSKFEQSSVTKTDAGGTGLGLAICREIISAHNGRIYAESHSQGGSVFVVRLPV